MSLEVPDRDEWFPLIDSFPRPQWPAIQAWKRAWVKKEKAGECMRQNVRHWLARVRAVLGGSYAVVESEHFQLLSAQEEKARKQTLSFLENTRARMIRTLGEVAWTSGTGPHVILRFSSADEYYHYIAHFCPDGEHAESAGVFLRAGYSHIAYPTHRSNAEERITLAHELAHNLVAHLPLPAWLDEALAQAFDTDLGGNVPHDRVDKELTAKHDAFWTAEAIQEFWIGRSFGTIEGQRVSYSLASVLLKIIHQELRPTPEAFRGFVLQSIRQDAGEAAAQDNLGASLGEIASVFLGPGDWTPKPDSWTAKKAKS